MACLAAAAQDYRYLLDRGYPRSATLTLVGNRYQLSAAAREILHRGVFSSVIAQARRRKLVHSDTLRGQPVALDGHNVVITLECARRGIPVVAADDGFIRDIGRLSRQYRPSALTTAVVTQLVEYLATQGLGPVQIWYDAPMSRSGELAALTRALCGEAGLLAEVQAVAVPEVPLLACGLPVASSDTQLIDQCQQLVDIAGELIRQDPAVRVLCC